MAAIQIENLVKRFGAFTALKAMDLEIRDREFMALLGPSGCGKSTTMNMIAGMEEPSEGRILFDGVDMAGVPLGRRGVGFVFQNYAIFTHMTVRGNLAYGLRMRGAERDMIDRRVKEIANLLQLTPHLDKPTTKLSVNILQRLAIGRSAAINPAIFLLDEPLSNVDAAFRAVMRAELKHLQREFKQTMVYVTHDQLEAMTMADRIAVMDHGVLQQVGTPLEVYNHPKNVFVARFIGSPGMNLLEGIPIQTRAGLAVDCGQAGISAPLPPELADHLRSGKRQPVLYGLRPEDALLKPGDSGEGLAMDVTHVERIGARTIIHLAAGEHSLKAIEANGYKVSIGERFRIIAESPRLFDKATGLAIAGARDG